MMKNISLVLAAFKKKERSSRFWSARLESSLLSTVLSCPVWFRAVWNNQTYLKWMRWDGWTVISGHAVAQSTYGANNIANCVKTKRRDWSEGVCEGRMIRFPFGCRPCLCLTPAPQVSDWPGDISHQSLSDFPEASSGNFEIGRITEFSIGRSPAENQNQASPRWCLQKYSTT